VEATRSNLLEDVQFLNPMWAGVSNKEQFMGVLNKLVAASKMPPKLLAAWEDFYTNYDAAVTGSGVPGATAELACKVQCTIADTVLNQFVDPYTFPSFHKRLLEPYNYYKFGQRYVSTLIDFDNSFLGYKERWDKIQQQLADGENVVLLANHQTEADPGVFAHMLASSHPNLATDVIYVAGDRVVSDALCKPFSMGRNLFCVYSKKYLDVDPATKSQKADSNRKTLIAMSRALNEGGCLIWIAPSGGRDRPNAEDKWLPDKMDPTAVELMRNLTSRSKKPGHLYPMAMYSYPIMPPPKTVVAELGERRLTAFSGVGISVCEPLDTAAIIAPAGDNKEAAQAALAEAAWSAVTAEYQLLDKAITQPAERAGMRQYVQPWKGPSSTASPGESAGAGGSPLTAWLAALWSKASAGGSA